MSESTLTADERALLIYLVLAEAAQRKKQQPGRDRFLVLSVHYALRAGLLETAEACSQIVKRNSPQHLLSKHPNITEAARSDLFPPLVKQLQRHCNLERAEQLAAAQDLQISSVRLKSDPAAFRQDLSNLISRLQSGSD
ncbi:MAG TPA: hypothetical protein DD473_17645 [Planctomycetaceae bacterium]|nr:hypothetical protein [Planctomycetaceae bacterium]|tara:strand:- start:297 stop:713 length:417 start_codon:yes stop_codon:yes gene_type:complete